jgi:DNA repair exonuclease SbcCD ATPase subunit
VDWEAQASTYQHDKTELERRYQLTHQALEDLRQQNLERDALEHARKQRAHKIELDLRQTQLLLQEATAGQKASAETQATLQESIQILQAANQSLHEQLTAHQDASRQESVRWNDILTKAARQSQQLRIQNEAADEDLERLQLDKAGVEQQNAQLKVQVGRLEAQLKEATSAAALTVTANNETSASAGGGLVSPTEAEQPSSLGGSSFSLPPLQSSADASTTKSADSTCCVCSKKSFGLMKTCPCGQPECPKRAHVLCAASRPAPISVSHPGTPAPVLPLVLCGAASCWKTPMATTSSSSDTEPATTE